MPECGVCVPSNGEVTELLVQSGLPPSGPAQGFSASPSSSMALRAHAVHSWSGTSDSAGEHGSMRATLANMRDMVAQ